MNGPDLHLSFKFGNRATGEVSPIEFDWDEMWSFTPPFQPAILNLCNTGKTRARDWRHAETGWYDEEHEFLTQVLKNRPDLEKMVNESRLLLYAVFVKTADSLGNMKLRNGSLDCFVSEYLKFCEKWRCCPSLPPALCSGKQPANQEDYLKAVRPESYAVVRRILPILASKDLRASRH